MSTKSTEDMLDLHVKCVRALRDYIAEANHTCKVLSDIESFPVSIDKRLAILEQRRAENVAAQRYQDARQGLFSAANWE